MPIRPENRARYPKNWPEISRMIRLRAGNCCGVCGLRNYRLGGRDSKGRWFDAMPNGTKGLGLDWPKPGELGWCYRGDERLFLTVIRIVLTVAHLDHTPENCDPENLRALCQRCHLAYDARVRRAGIKARAREAAACGDLFNLAAE